MTGRRRNQLKMVTTVKPIGSGRQLDKGDEAYYRLPAEFQVFVTAVSVLTVLALLYALICRLSGFPLPYSAPYYFIPRNMFLDFQGFRDRFHAFGTPLFFRRLRGEYVMYPAPLLFPIAAFFKFPHPIRAYMGFILSVAGISSYSFYSKLRHAGLQALSAALFVAVVLTTSYPFLFLLQRGNLELIAWIPLTIGIWSCYRGKYYWAAVCFGFATAFKMYPFMFFALLLARKQYRAIALGAAVIFTLVLASLAALGPSVQEAYRWNSIQLAAFGTLYAGATWSLGYDHSFLGLIKFIVLSGHPDLTRYVGLYTAAMASLGLAIYFGRLRNMPNLNQLLVLTILSITIPPVSYDYTLVSLYPIFAILCVEIVKAHSHGEDRASLQRYFLLFALVLTPESYAVIAGVPFGAQIRCVCLIFVLISALRTPIQTGTTGTGVNVFSPAAFLA